MIRCDAIALDEPDPRTGSSRGWTVTLADGRTLPWQGFYTGPRTLAPEEIDATCRSLLGFGAGEVAERVDAVLRPVTREKARGPAMILHSTTPELKTFDGEVHALSVGTRPSDATTYKESRSPYLGRPGDLAVGRTRTWKKSADAVAGVTPLELPDREHYYLSHALLHLARRHLSEAVPAIARLVRWVRGHRPFVKLYALEPEMQIFLLWLARAAGLGELYTDANRPAISAAWNRKSVLHPTVRTARELADRLAGLSPEQVLNLESEHCHLAVAMGLDVPAIPGYTIERDGRDAGGFVRQVLDAAGLLRERYDLELGCLKASESGDGARITPGLVLTDRARLEELGREAHRHGDDYVLEAHVRYSRVTISGHELPTAISAHIRDGQVADGATLQFVEGTSWKGNLYLDELTHSAFGLDASRYRHVRAFMEDYVAAFQERSPGLVTGGIDFALGQVGGRFGEERLFGVQDLNISFTGAECLRAFLDKARARTPERALYGVTRIYRPRPESELPAFRELTEKLRDRGIFAETVASIPGRWAMVGVAGSSPAEAMDHLRALQGEIVERRLIESCP